MMDTKTEIRARQAVNDAVTLVLQNPGTSGAESMARVLLHAYDHGGQPFDITDLCILDQPHEANAWVILKARVNGVEPHELVSDKESFQRIVELYEHARRR